MSKKELLAWYFPNWHADPRNDKWHGKGWTEWEVAKCARPRFEGHSQPKEPLWGYLDESDPKVMEQKIAAAKEHGITGFLWDTYWFHDGGYRMKALDQGFFGAKNNEDFKIGLVWCNHDPIYVHPASYLNGAQSLLSGEMSAEGFKNMTDHFIKNYFCRPNYLKINGKIYFGIYAVQKFVDGVGGREKAHKVIEDLRERVRAAGLGEMYITGECRNCECATDKEGVNKFFNSIGFDALFRYGWPMEGDSFPKYDYKAFIEGGIATYQGDKEFFDLPVSITVQRGWDSSPRTVQSDMYENIGFPFLPITVGENTADFGRALKAAKEFSDSDDYTCGYVTLSTWNEWTEGSYLEPDTEFGYGFLEEIKKVFGN